MTTLDPALCADGCGRLATEKRPYADNRGTELVCAVCWEPFTLTDIGLIGLGGVCRDPYNPNQDDEGMHIVARYPSLEMTR